MPIALHLFPLDRLTISTGNRGRRYEGWSHTVEGCGRAPAQHGGYQ